MGTRSEEFTPDELELMKEMNEKAAGAENAQSTDHDEDVQAQSDESSGDALAQDAQAQADESKEAGAADDAAPQGEAIAETSAAEEAVEGDGAFVPRFDGQIPANYEDQKKALRAEKAELRQKWSSGELSDEEWSTAESALEDKYEALRDEYLTAQALKKANEQIQAQQQQDTLKKLATEAKRAGIDYADPGLASLFDNRLAQVAADEAFNGKPFDAIAAEANKRVLELFGKTGGNSAQSTTQATQATPTMQEAANKGKPAPERPRIPPTLSSMPAAASQPVGSDLSDQLDAIDDPDLLEAKWAALPAQQRSAMLRSTLPARR